MAVLLETTLGDVVIDLYTEERPRGEAPALLTFRRAALFFSPALPFLPSPRRGLAGASGLTVPATAQFISGPWLKSLFLRATLLRLWCWPVGWAGACGY